MLTNGGYLDLLFYMITSADELENEPGVYGSVRMITCSKKLCRLIQSDEPDDKGIKELLELLEKVEQKGTDDEEEFYRMLQDISVKLIDLIY